MRIPYSVLKDDNDNIGTVVSEAVDTARANRAPYALPVSYTHLDVYKRQCFQ